LEVEFFRYEGGGASDSTYVSIVIESTFPLFFDNKNRWGKDYGFNGSFEIVDQKWHPDNVHLQTVMKKCVAP
jgi:aminopeptidase C